MTELTASLQSAAGEKSPLERPLATRQISPTASREENAGVSINTSLLYANARANATQPLNFSAETVGTPRELEI